MSDITQSTNPVVTEPTVLDEEALRPVNLMERMEAEARRVNAIAKPAEQPAPRRGRGRPPGAKNRATLEREAQLGVPRNPPSRLVPPPRRPTRPLQEGEEKTPEQLEAERVARREARERRVGEITETITEGLNEQIMVLLEGMGVPATLLYKPGYVPKAEETNTKYSSLALNVIIKPNQATTFAKFAYELEQTDTGKKVSDLTGNSKSSLLLYGALSLAGAIQYAKGLQRFTRELAPMMEQALALQRQMEESRLRHMQSDIPGNMPEPKMEDNSK